MKMSSEQQSGFLKIPIQALLKKKNIHYIINPISRAFFSRLVHNIRQTIVDFFLFTSSLFTTNLRHYASLYYRNMHNALKL